MPNTSDLEAGAQEEREGFYEKLWKDFVSLQRGDIQGICAKVERYYREQESAPAVAQPCVWLILFDDQDRKPEIFTLEAAARKRYADISMSWNAHLFVKVNSNSRDDPWAEANAHPPAGQKDDGMVSVPRELLRDVVSLRNLDYNIGAHPGSGKDDSGVTLKEYSNAAERIQERIDAMLAAASAGGQKGGND